MAGTGDGQASDSIACKDLSGCLCAHLGAVGSRLARRVLRSAGLGHGAGPGRSDHVVGSAEAISGLSLILGGWYWLWVVRRRIWTLPLLQVLAYYAGAAALWLALVSTERGLLPDRLQRLPAGLLLPAIAPFDHSGGRGPHRPVVGHGVPRCGAAFGTVLTDRAALSRPLHPGRALGRRHHAPEPGPPSPDRGTGGDPSRAGGSGETGGHPRRARSAWRTRFTTRWPRASPAS